MSSGAQERGGGDITIGSEEALLDAIKVELLKVSVSPHHGEITLSCSTYLMSNGIKCCNVQVECNSGCGHLIVAFNEEAELLDHLALVIKGMLGREVIHDACSAVPEISRQ